jgi:hypothetical protein
MTALSLHLPSGRDYRAGSFRRFALNLINGFREALETLDRYEHLARKSDSELAALKLHREDLPAIAMNGRH